MKETSINNTPGAGHSALAAALNAATKAVDEVTAEFADEAAQLLAVWALDISTAVPEIRQGLDQLMQLTRLRSTHQGRSRGRCTAPQPSRRKPRKRSGVQLAWLINSAHKQISMYWPGAASKISRTASVQGKAQSRASRSTSSRFGIATKSD